MQNQARDLYQQSEILDADPARLIVFLYRGAMDAIGRARQHLLAGRIRERSNEISRAYEIVAELASAVDLEQGGELPLNLLRLYDYCGQQLLDANAQQSAAPLAQAEAVLKTLLDAWETVAPAAGATQAPPLAGRRPLNLSA